MRIPTAASDCCQNEELPSAPLPGRRENTFTNAYLLIDRTSVGRTLRMPCVCQILLLHSREGGQPAATAHRTQRSMKMPALSQVLKKTALSRRPDAAPRTATGTQTADSTSNAKPASESTIAEIQAISTLRRRVEFCATWALVRAHEYEGSNGTS